MGRFVCPNPKNPLGSQPQYGNPEIERIRIIIIYSLMSSYDKRLSSVHIAANFCIPEYSYLVNMNCSFTVIFQV
jgi:hypothetical protein